MSVVRLFSAALARALLLLLPVESDLILVTTLQTMCDDARLSVWWMRQLSIRQYTIFFRSCSSC